ncbi:transposase [Lentimicrobium sp.]|jgi:REP element-mobilizing transposase RayT|uniref:REP-associated tyrosine transposase n=1 Tax=Lentimicrobium sp. TaxID=2034841 RepID=UPI002CF37D40|nr:transposase [Lentimicrobium sp.]MCO5263481.1 transposase [Lentimicrobium sp.]HPF65440.1 transposase [Lentimicrobium sp.]HPJ63009.1 transposase [Lentimicrobium sp.]HPR27094.1 transposase [Lentimicrobium sp.]HRW70190.1 transposase [Lentimicrobium sp.]
MSDKYRIWDNDKAYFLTLTVTGWIDIFTRLEQKLLIINSLKYCQENKGLIIYAYCLMPSHLHMICQAAEPVKLSDILRDFKSFTSKEIINQILEGSESRKEWLLKLLSSKQSKHDKGNKFQVWQPGNHAKVLYSNRFIYEKLNYIHQNPVKDLIVEKPEDYLFSSARNYAELSSFLDVVVLGAKPLFLG